MRGANRGLDIILDEEEEADQDGDQSADINEKPHVNRDQDGSICFFKKESISDIESSGQKEDIEPNTLYDSKEIGQISVDSSFEIINKKHHNPGNDHPLTLS